MVYENKIQDIIEAQNRKPRYNDKINRRKQWSYMEYSKKI